MFAAPNHAGKFVAFGGNGDSVESAFQEAEERAREAFRGIAAHEIQGVQGVHCPGD